MQLPLWASVCMLHRFTIADRSVQFTLAPLFYIICSVAEPVQTEVLSVPTLYCSLNLLEILKKIVFFGDYRELILKH
jgi:hypothetical protein